MQTEIVPGYYPSTSSTFADVSAYSDMDGPTLKDQITHHFVESHFPLGWKRMYMPGNGLRELITRPSIIREFSRDLDPKEQLQVDENLISFILTSAPKLLAITLIAGIDSSRLQGTMEIFQRSQFTDDQLPVTLNSEDKRFPWSALKWTASTKTAFKEMQWRFLVRVLSKEERIMELRAQEILPFHLVNEQRREGTFCDVWEVEVHEAHQKKPIRVVSVRFGALDHELTGYRWTAVAGLAT